MIEINEFTVFNALCWIVGVLAIVVLVLNVVDGIEQAQQRADRQGSVIDSERVTDGR